MLRLMRALFWWLQRTVLGLRYTVRVEGLERLRDLSGPTLVMPNHPGYIDPPLVVSHVVFRDTVRPLVASSMYRHPLLYPFMRLVEALEVPDLREHSHDARQRTLAMIDAVVAGLERGESFLLYPSGRAQRSGVEVVGASRAVYDILQRFPRAHVVLVRTRGVWGSSFSYARTGNPPHLGRCLARGLALLLANLVFFAPRRRVTMTVELADGACLAGMSREKLNRYLEEWYNRPGPEQPTFVPAHFLFGPRQFEFPRPQTGESVDDGQIKPATKAAVNEMIEERLGRPLGEEERQAKTLLEQIGLDSLARMELSLAIEDRFGFRSDRVPETLGELWTLAEGLRRDQTAGPDRPPPLWERPPSDSRPHEILAETLAEAFVRRALRQMDDPAVADELSGVLSYRRLLVATSLLAKKFGELPGEALGVMLPASVAADVVFFGLHLAGKLPSMLNWTTGPANLAHAVKILGIKRVVTSRRLIDRLGIAVAGAEYVFLEDLRPRIGKFAALRAMLATYLFPRTFLRGLPRPKVDDPAVVLFTSGSESAPKAVPLSHRNLVVNMRAAIAALGTERTDRLLGFLPPFHSFGLTANLVVSVLAGIPVVHHPDPTDAAGLVRAVARYRATILVATPTFLSYMCGLASPDDLKSLRVIVTGAEKCPESLFARVAQLAPKATILEGYGVTECSPIVSGNRPNRSKRGTVGPPVDGVEVRVVDPETYTPLPANTTGMLLVSGPSVFRGYLAYEGPEPFVEQEGKRWYVTGDLVQIDEEGFIRFQGRLKRFLKAGGEMISLPALEEPFARLYPPGDSGPQVAVEGIETPDGRRIALFTTREISLREANAILAEAGFRGVMRVDETIRLDAIPVLGTGKTDYKVLRKMLADRAAPGSA
jgi:acyl-CoA synthetase (AMP-forming)/AMP-acid ligase II/1-acyl-sn-glycerol-3-phosphate acyltransferase/acyl carrier protein